MSLQSIHLRKLLKVMYLQPKARTSALRADIRDDIAREAGDSGSGGDFYGPFWRDAKDHVFGNSDLIDQTKLRIALNARRDNLYPRLCSGFLLWWNERRRWTNQPFVPAAPLKAVVRLREIDASIKCASILSVMDGAGEDHFVYPYWFPEPAISDEAARLALWVLCSAFPDERPAEIRLLDVIRGQTFSLDRNPMRGDEEGLFKRRFDALVSERDALRKEYS